MARGERLREDGMWGGALYLKPTNHETSTSWAEAAAGGQHFDNDFLWQKIRRVIGSLVL